MSDNTNATEIKKLRDEVQLLRDELAIMKRKYEDIIYNLDTDNFSSRFVREQGDMRTAIEVNAKGIKTKVSKEELDSAIESSITQNADAIKVAVKEVTGEELKNYATTEWTEDQITQEVTSLQGEDERLSAKITQNADSIQSVVSRCDDLGESITTITQTADTISTQVGNLKSGKFGDYTLFSQSGNKFVFDGSYMDITSAIRLCDNLGNHAFSIFHQESDKCVYMWGAGNYEYFPVVIGNKSTKGEQPIYLYSEADGNRIATRDWVRKDANIVAVFG